MLNRLQKKIIFCFKGIGYIKNIEKKTTNANSPTNFYLLLREKGSQNETFAKKNKLRCLLIFYILIFISRYNAPFKKYKNTKYFTDIEYL